MGACLSCQGQADQEKASQQILPKKGDLESASRTEPDHIRSEQGSGDWKGVESIGKDTVHAHIYDEDLSIHAKAKEVRTLIPRLYHVHADFGVPPLVGSRVAVRQSLAPHCNLKKHHCVTNIPVLIIWGPTPCLGK